MSVIKLNDLVNIVVEETCAKCNVNKNESKVDFVGMYVKFELITMIMKNLMNVNNECKIGGYFLKDINKEDLI